MEKQHVIVLASPGFRGLEALDPIRGEAHFHFVNTVEDAGSVIGQAEVIFAWDHARHGLLEVLWPSATSVRWVQSGSAGVESVLFGELVESSVVLTNATGLYSDVLAEFVVASILYFAQNLDRLRSLQMARIWSRLEVLRPSSQTLGIVGLGDVGRAAAALAHCLNMRLLGCRRNPEKADEGLPIERIYTPDRLLEMLPECDYVLLCVPLTPETTRMFGKAQLEVMKPSSVLINIARGGVVQEEALIQALQEGSIRGAALDVFEREPLPTASPLWGMENVLLSPHSADHTFDLETSAGRLFVENFRRYLKEEPLLNIVDKQAGY